MLTAIRHISLFMLFLTLTSACTGKDGSTKLITVSPESAVVKMGSTTQFSVSPAGTAVTWSIKGDSEGLLGVIDTSGSYSAPSDPSTAPEKVVITARDSSGTTGSTTTFLTTFNSNKRLTTNYAKGSDEADTYSSGQKSIAVFKDSDSNVNVYAVWADNSLGNSHIWFTKSSDNGESFSPHLPIDESSSANQISPSIVADSNGNGYIVWEDYREGDADIRLVKYDGTGFGTLQKVYNDLGNITDYDSSPSVALNTTGDIYVVWVHRGTSDDNYPDIYFSKSTDEGQTFSSPITITTEGRRPSIAVDSSGIAYVVWENLSEFPLLSPTHVMISKVGNDGSFTTKQVDSFTGNSFHARFPSVTLTPDGKKVYVTWQRAEITSPAFDKEVTLSYDIDLAVIDAASISITESPSIPDSDNAGYVGGPAYPTVASDNNYVYIVWDDQRNGSLTKDIYFTKSSDGVTFTTNRIINDDSGLWHEKPSGAVLDGKGYVIWTDFRNNSGDVFFASE